MDKKQKMHFGLYNSFSTDFLKKKKSKNYTAKIGESPNFDVWFFEILLIPRQKANTSHSLIIKYSHYGGGFNCLFSSPPRWSWQQSWGFQGAAAVSHLSQDPGKPKNGLEGCSWLQEEGGWGQGALGGGERKFCSCSHSGLGTWWGWGCTSMFVQINPHQCSSVGIRKAEYSMATKLPSRTSLEYPGVVCESCMSWTRLMVGKQMEVFGQLMVGWILLWSMAWILGMSPVPWRSREQLCPVDLPDCRPGNKWSRSVWEEYIYLLWGAAAAKKMSWSDVPVSADLLSLEILDKISPFALTCTGPGRDSLGTGFAWSGKLFIAREWPCQVLEFCCKSLCLWFP